MSGAAIQCSSDKLRDPNSNSFFNIVTHNQHKVGTISWKILSAMWAARDVWTSRLPVEASPISAQKIDSGRMSEASKPDETGDLLDKIFETAETTPVLCLQDVPSETVTQMTAKADNLGFGLLSSKERRLQFGDKGVILFDRRHLESMDYEVQGIHSKGPNHFIQNALFKDKKTGALQQVMNVQAPDGVQVAKEQVASYVAEKANQAAKIVFILGYASPMQCPEIKSAIYEAISLSSGSISMVAFREQCLDFFRTVPGLSELNCLPFVISVDSCRSP